MTPAPILLATIDIALARVFKFLSAIRNPSHDCLLDATIPKIIMTAKYKIIIVYSITESGVFMGVFYVLVYRL